MWRATLGDERGIALVMAIIILASLTALVLAFLSASAFEPQISRNLADTTTARYVADAGMEFGFNALASSLDWNVLLGGGGALATDSPLPGLAATAGTFTVTVRNDVQANDNQITGVALDGGGAASDTNSRVILTSVGTFNNVTRTIAAVVRRIQLPPVNAALAFPGVQADVNFDGSSFVIRGSDTNMDGTAGAASPLYGISVCGTCDGNETSVENALNNNQQNEVSGRDETSATNPPATTTGNNAINKDATLTSQAVTDFVTALKASADISLTASPDDPYEIQDIGASCAANIYSTTCWGTVTHPKIVYVRGDLPDLATQFTALDISGSSTGTGILIVENGNVDISGSFRWNGPIIVTGNNVGLRYRGGGDQAVYGAVIVNELHNDGAANLEGDIRGNASILYSRQAIDLVRNGLGRRTMSMYSWREQ
jgi:hypothetical protein